MWNDAEDTPTNSERSPSMVIVITWVVNRVSRFQGLSCWLSNHSVYSHCCVFNSRQNYHIRTAVGDFSFQPFSAAYKFKCHPSLSGELVPFLDHWMGIHCWFCYFSIFNIHVSYYRVCISWNKILLSLHKAQQYSELSYVCRSVLISATGYMSPKPMPNFPTFVIDWNCKRTYRICQHWPQDCL